VTTSSPDIFDRQLLRRRRDRLAGRAARHEFLLARVADDIVERLAAVRRTFPTVLNLGAHHGLLGRRVAALPGVATVIDAEASSALLAQCSGLRVQCDEEVLPVRDQSLDLIVSGLSLQLVNDLPGVLVQMRRALKPDGLLLAAMLGGATLTELRTALLVAEAEIEGGASPRVAPFADVRDLGALLQRAQFALPVVDSETVVVTYSDPLALMHELRGMGGASILHARTRKPLRRRTLERSSQIYAERFGLANGRIRATFEIITLTGWAQHESQPKPLQPGSAKVRLADALGTAEQPAGDTARPDKTRR
jgi:NADH dehydrogenase [ubiquinone] 1 alpha subcomplex assembly factor 5